MKAIRAILLSAVLALFSRVLYGQVPIGGIINTYVDVTGTTACLNQLVVSSSAGFAINDTVLVIQMKGATIDETNTASFGTVTAYNNSGKYEKAIIADISGTTIYFTKNLVNTYNIPAGRVQLVKIRQFASNVNVTSPLQAADWNGLTGGVLALEVVGTLTLASTVDANGKGFIGGANTQVCPNGCSFSTNETAYFYPTGNYRGGLKGEGIAATIATKELGRGPQANGGGGGNDHNNGGAGGANVSTGGLGGNNNEPGAFNCKGGNNYGRSGIALSLATNRLFLGGGGGAGQGNNGATGGCPNNGNSGFGGDGGGVIYISAGTFSGGGNIVSANGTAGQLANGDGGGGGGAGGIIVMNVGSYTSAVTLQVNGGNGGNTSGFGGNRCFGPGGGGSAGVVISSAALPGLVTLQMNGGSPGVVTSSSNICVGTSTTATAGGNTAAAITTFTMPAGTVDPAPGCILPVEFLGISGRQEFSDVVIDWQTASETKSEIFEIERSASLDEPFQKIGQKDAAGESHSILSYDFTDTHPIHGKGFYRLRQVDTDGTSSYSEIVMVNYTTELNFISNVFPNPSGAASGVTVEFDLPKDATAGISLMDATGRLIRSVQIEGKAGSNAVQLPLTGISDGLYFVVVSGAGFVDNARIQVLNP